MVLETLQVIGTGPFLLSNLTSGGSITLNFSIGGVAQGDEIVFHVESVVEVPDHLEALFLAEFSTAPKIRSDTNRAFLQWSFPDSGEDATRGFGTIP